MAASARLSALAAGAVALAALAATVAVPVAPVAWRASSPPGVAAARVEREAPSVGLGWGRLRGWEREGEGWRLVWQPAHGAWMVRAWVADGPAPIAWRLDAASWLPGVRLSEHAARSLVGGTDGGAAREQSGRRDWAFADARLLGALPAGGRLPASERTPGPPWVVLLGGCLVAGALSRAVFPGAVSAAWRRVTVVSAVFIVPTLPFATALGADSFRVGVRPWIAELVVVGAALVLLGAVAAAAVRFPAPRGAPRGLAVLLAAAAGLLAGRLQPVPQLADIAGLNIRGVLWAALIVLCGWLAALGGEGLRELLRPVGPLRSTVLLVLGVAALLTAGPWLAAILGLVASAAGDRGDGPWVGTAVAWGWIVGGTLASCAWAAPLRDAVVLLLAGAAAITVLLLRDARRTTASDPAPARSRVESQGSRGDSQLDA